jgi:hypothetical protein
MHKRTWLILAIFAVLAFALTSPALATRSGPLVPTVPSNPAPAGQRTPAPIYTEGPAYKPTAPSPSDPTAAIVQSSVTQIMGMFTAAQKLGKELFLWIFLIEIAVFGYHMVLNRDNLAELFSSLAMKMLGFSFFAFLIFNFGIVGQVINGFQSAATTISGTAPGSASQLIGNMLSNAGLVMGFASAAEAEDSGLADVDGIMVLGSGDPGAAIASTLGHEIFEPCVMGIAGMEILGAFAIAFQNILLQIEIAIVTSVGIFFLAFSTSRYTSQYSQGVLSYMFNVGAKVIAFQIFIAIAINLSNTQSLIDTVSLGTAAVIPEGFGSLALLFGATVGGFSALLIGVLANAVPGIASSFMTGATTVSGQAALSHAIGGVAGAQSMLAGVAQKAEAAHQRAEHRERTDTLLDTSAPPAYDSLADVPPPPYEAPPPPYHSTLDTVYKEDLPNVGSALHNASKDSMLSPAGSKDSVLSPPPSYSPAWDASSKESLYADDVFNVGSVMPPGNPPQGTYGGPSLKGLDEHQIRGLSDAEFSSRLSQTSASEREGRIADVIRSDGRLSELAKKQIRGERRNDWVQRTSADATFWQGIERMAPHGEGQQAPVEIRIEHRD